MSLKITLKYIPCLVVWGLHAKCRVEMCTYNNVTTHMYIPRHACHLSYIKRPPIPPYHCQKQRRELRALRAFCKGQGGREVCVLRSSKFHRPLTNHRHHITPATTVGLVVYLPCSRIICITLFVSRWLAYLWNILGRSPSAS